MRTSPADKNRCRDKRGQVESILLVHEGEHIYGRDEVVVDEEEAGGGTDKRRPKPVGKAEKPNHPHVSENVFARSDMESAQCGGQGGWAADGGYIGKDAGFSTGDRQPGWSAPPSRPCDARTSS